MTAPFSDELLSAYLDGELNAEERAFVEAQLRERVELRRLCDELRALRSTLQAMPVTRPPENFAERVLRQAERQMLADSDATEKEAAYDESPSESPSESPVELRKWPWLEDPRWRAGIGVVAGLAACLLAMVFLYPPAALQNTRSVALSPDAISHPSEDASELATQFRDNSSAPPAMARNRNVLVRGREKSLGFAEDSTAAKSAERAVEMPAVEMAMPSAPEPSSTAPPAPAALAAPMRPPGQTGSDRKDSYDSAAGEADSATRRMVREETDSGTRDWAAGATLEGALPPVAPSGGGGAFGAAGDRGTVQPGGAGMPGGGMGGMGGMGGARSGLGSSMGGGLGSGGRTSDQPTRGGTEMRFGQATDAPADAAPSNAPPSDLAHDSRYVYTPDAQSLTADSLAETRYFALPLEPTAWAGTPVTTESLEQCTAQLEQARFLLVKVTAPDRAPDKPSSAATAEPREAEGAEILFRKLRSVVPTPLEIERILVEPNENIHMLADAPGMPQQALVVDASSELIRRSIDQLVSQPDVSVELATHDSPVAKQLAEVESAKDAMAKDKAAVGKVPALGRPMRAAGEPTATPAPPAPPQDPAPVAERPATPPTERSGTPSRDEAPPHDTAAREAMAGKVAASAPEKGATPNRVVFYILYRLAPDPAAVVPAAPADAAGGR